MSKELAEYLSSLNPELKFKSKLHYSKELDALIMYFYDVPSYAENIDKDVVVFRSIDDNSIVGFKINSASSFI
jgi:hypothetical protein